MQRILNFFSDHPWLVLATLLLVSVLAATQLSSLRVQVSADELLIADDPERDYFNAISQQFGDEKVVLLYLHDAEPYKISKLEKLEQVIAQLEKLDFVDRTESLFSIPYLKTVDGYLNKDAYLANLPKTDIESSKLFDIALKNPFLKNVILSADGKSMAVAIVLKSDLSGFTDEQITRTLDQKTASLNTFYEKAFVLGYQHVRTEIAHKIRQEQGDLFPLAVLALLVALFVLLRQLLDIVLPAMTAGLSILWTLGLMGFLDIPLNIVTSMVPVLLIIVGSTEDIHLLTEFRRSQQMGLDKIQAIRQMSRKMGGIVLLTFVTTYIGFLSVGLSKIEVLWQFGLVASTGLLLNFLATVSLIPAVLKLTGHRQLDGKPSVFHDASRKRAKKYYQWLLRHDKFIVAAVVIVSLVSSVGLGMIHVNHNAIDSLGKSSVVRAHFDDVNRDFAGLESLSIIIDSGIQDTFLKVRYLEQLVNIQQYIADAQYSRSTTSFADYLSLLNAAFEEEVEPFMPDSDEIVQELMIFLKYEHVRAYVSEDFSRARILVRHDRASTDELKLFVDDLQRYLDNNLDKGLTARITGDSVLTLSATRSMISGQLKSISLLLIIIISIITLLFMDWRVGLLAALPNIFPVIVLFGVMGLMNIPLNIGTTMAAAIAIGIAVDDTMHIMLRYNMELKSRKNQNVAMYATLQNEALPVFATGISLIAGFLVFSLSDFEPVQQFGLLSALVMLTALLADFVITPIAISRLRLVTLWDLLSLSVRKEVISNSILFHGMRTWEIRRFILASTVSNFKPGECIFRYGDESADMYLVMTGKVEVTHTGKGIDKNIKECFSPGDIFGDVSMFARTERKTDAVAVDHSSLLILSRDGIQNTANYHPIISSRLFFNIATHISQRFVALLAKKPKA